MRCTIYKKLPIILNFKQIKIMYDYQIKTATRQKNISAIGIVIVFFLLGVFVGVLFNPAIINFLESLTKIIKSI